MKMKEMKEHLNAQGYAISERMVQYYIRIGILPPVDYPHANQAVYTDIHLVRLMRIGQMKKKGIPFNQIKDCLLGEKEAIEKEAQKRNISFGELCVLQGIYALEEAEYFKNEFKDHHFVFTKDEMMEKSSCDKLVFELAVDTGAIENKQNYNQNDLLVLLGVKNLMENKTDGQSGNIIEKISDISKINNIATQLVNMYAADIDKKWIYEYLIESIIRRKLPAAKKKDA